MFISQSMIEGWTRNGRSIRKNENKKYRSQKMFPSDIILKFKSIVKFN